MRAFACVFLGVLFLALPPAEAAGQAGTLTGVVQNSAGGDPVSSVQVFISDLNLGGLTQQNGRFLLQNVPAGTHMVTAERIGFRSQTQTVNVTAGGTVTLNWAMTEDAIQLDEVIVTGTPGGTRRRAIGNSVTSVDASEITGTVAVTGVQDLLTARSPGLQYNRMANSIGTGSDLQIRGTGSFDLGTQPIIYVDGIRISNERVGVRKGFVGPESNPLDDFNPDDIESIEIIKGPAAATLYGTEASAGVIQIITKKGVEGDAQFEFTVAQGQNFTLDPSFQFGYRTSCKTSAVPLCPSEADLFTYNMYDEASALIAQKAFPWPTDNLYKNGFSRNYNLNITGGTAAVRYFVSGNYSNEQGALFWNKDENKRFRSNITALLSDNLTLDISAGYINGHHRAGEPLFNEGGIWRVTKLSWGRCLPRMNLDSCPRRLGFTDFRPDDISKIEGTREYERVTGSATLNYAYGDWLTQRLVIGVDRGFDINQTLFPREAALEPTIGQTILGALDRESFDSNNFSFDYAATGAYDLNESIRLTTSVGAQFYKLANQRVTTNGKEFPTEFATTINQTNIQQLNLGYSFIENKSLGFYVQEELGWNDRLFLTGAVRFDDNSAFGANFETQRYPKISGTYVVSEENFWNVDFVNSLRVRGAWGKAGRQPDALSGLNTYQTFRGVGARTAIGPDSPGDPGVGPEVSTEWEVGFDVAVMDDRLSGEFTYFYQKNEDALRSTTQPTSTGFPGAVQKNVGRIDNWGWEASVNARLYTGEGASFDLMLAADHVMNEIKDLGEGYGGTTNIRVGLPYPQNTTSYKILSADLVKPGEFTNAMCDSGIPIGPDDIGGSRRAYKFGGPAVACADVGDLDLLIGPWFHTYTWTVGPTLNLFNNSLRLFAMAQGMYGRTHEDSIAEWTHFFNGSRVKWLQDDPIYIAGCHRLCPYEDNTVDDAYPGDFWRMREIGARYQLPGSVIDRVGVERASISFSGRNMFLLWRKQDSIAGVNIGDPEMGNRRAGRGPDSNWWHGPPIASAHLTLRVTF